MSADRRIRLWALVVSHAGEASPTVEHVCAAMLAAAGVEHAAITVSLSASPWETVYASSPAAAATEDLTFKLGQGPGVDGLAGSPVLVPDLEADLCRAEWPVFTPAALGAGLRAMFVLPLQVGAIEIGVLTLSRSHPGNLDAGQLADALVLADTALALLLDGYNRLGAPVRDGGPELNGLSHPEVHQATGMIVVQLGVSATVALVRLRAYAYAHDRLLRDVANEVVARRLRFSNDT